MLLRANAALIAEHGWQAVMDGGLRQLAELLLTGYASMAAYIVAKVCEDRLVRQLGGERDTPDSQGVPPVPGSEQPEGAGKPRGDQRTHRRFHIHCTRPSRRLDAQLCMLTPQA